MFKQSQIIRIKVDTDNPKSQIICVPEEFKSRGDHKYNSGILKEKPRKYFKFLAKNEENTTL